MQRFIYFLTLLMIISACSKDDNHQDCSLKPEVGNCKGSLPRYYFDQAEQRCKVFFWGGCDGVVPFETIEDCNKKCPCQGK